MFWSFKKSVWERKQVVAGSMSAWHAATSFYSRVNLKCVKFFRKRGSTWAFNHVFLCLTEGGRELCNDRKSARVMFFISRVVPPSSVCAPIGASDTALFLETLTAVYVASARHIECRSDFETLHVSCPQLHSRWYQSSWWAWRCLYQWHKGELKDKSLLQMKHSVLSPSCCWESQAKFYSSQNISVLNMSMWTCATVCRHYKQQYNML